MTESTQERREKLRQSRQVIAGPDLPDVGEWSPFPDGGTPTQSVAFWYLVGLSVLVVLGAVLWAVWGMGAASPVLLVLAVALFAAWFVF